jgi:hypothetical protein
MSQPGRRRYLNWYMRVWRTLVRGSSPNAWPPPPHGRHRDVAHNMHNISMVSRPRVRASETTSETALRNSLSNAAATVLRSWIEPLSL